LSSTARTSCRDRLVQFGSEPDPTGAGPARRAGGFSDAGIGGPASLIGAGGNGGNAGLGTTPGTPGAGGAGGLLLGFPGNNGLT
jgi:hypothetical protein